MGAITSGFFNVLPILQEVAGAVNMVEQSFNNITQPFVDPEQQRRDQLRAEQDLALEQLKQKQQLQERQVSEQATLDREALTVESQQAEEERRQSLRRAVARQRAQFGARGIGAAGSGSSEAVLLGMFDETDGDRQKREQIDNIRSRSIELDTSQNRSLNLLQATQLVQRQNLERQIFGARNPDFGGSTYF